MTPSPDVTIDREVERQWSDTARARTPVEWRTLVRQIKCRPARIQAACIVWWDYFGSRNASERWPHLDRYVDAWRRTPRASRAKLLDALLQLGYPERLAMKRIKSMEDDRT